MFNCLIKITTAEWKTGEKMEKKEEADKEEKKTASHMFYINLGMWITIKVLELT